MPGHPFQESELFNLGFALLSICFLYAVRLQIPRFMAAGFVAVVVGYVSTVIEEVYLNQVFNSIEHLSYAVAGICFFLACRDLSREQHVSPPEKV